MFIDPTVWTGDIDEPISRSFDALIFWVFFLSFAFLFGWIGFIVGRLTA